MPRQSPPESRLRVPDSLAAGRSIGQLAAESSIGAATLYHWQHEDRIDAGDIPGPDTAQAPELADAKRKHPSS
jgi:transposase